MPIPSRRLKAKMMLGLKVAGTGAKPADNQKTGSNQNMETMETGSHVEGRGINPVLKSKCGVLIFIGLQCREGCTKNNGDAKAFDQILAISLEHGGVRPGHRATRKE